MLFAYPLKDFIAVKILQIFLPSNNISQPITMIMKKVYFPNLPRTEHHFEKTIRQKISNALERNITFIFPFVPLNNTSDNKNQKIWAVTVRFGSVRSLIRNIFDLSRDPELLIQLRIVRWIPTIRHSNLVLLGKPRTLIWTINLFVVRVVHFVVYVAQSVGLLDTAVNYV